MKRKIIGIDLGVNSIGWAYTSTNENKINDTKIIDCGVRVIPLSADEIKNFEEGKKLTTNAERTSDRSARRNLQRYKLRRKELIKNLIDFGIINDNSILTEMGKNSTYELLELRAKACKSKIKLTEFARVLLKINKKRGYKSNRKLRSKDEGKAINSIEIAKIIYENNLTPGAYSLKLLNDGEKYIPDFYHSDLKKEFKKIWVKQSQYYTEIFTQDLYDNLIDKNQKQTWAILHKNFNITGKKRKGNKQEQRLENYQLRVKGLSEKLELEDVAIVLTDINNQLNKSNNYLGNISDRSKELYFKNLTIGEYLLNIIKKDRHKSLKNIVFYRQDYMDEFEKIWEMQAKYYPDILTEDRKKIIRDIIIFYQRKLKSQKSLISICELEGKEKEIEIDGIKKTKIIGPRVCPKSSPIFQEFKIWQNLNNLTITNKRNNESYELNKEQKDLLFEELNIKGKLKDNKILKILGLKTSLWKLNFKEVQGNETNKKLYEAYQKILLLSGHDAEKLFDYPASYIKEFVIKIFDLLKIDSELTNFKLFENNKKFVEQSSYKLWHLLYSFEGDNSKSGNEKLIEKLNKKFNIIPQYGKIIAEVVFENDYSNLSTKAIKKILPHLKEGHKYADACSLEGYNHSKSETKDEKENRKLSDKLELIPRNSLRNPVVEKILNQMVNLINQVIDKYGKPDEIRIEMARDLKRSAKERENLTKNIRNQTKLHEKIQEELKKIPPFNQGVRITRKDIIKYKLWKELEPLGYKTLYTNTYVSLDKLFTNNIEIEHIIPKERLFDDSFSNKTLSTKSFNTWKNTRTGIDAMIEKYGSESKETTRYIKNVKELYNNEKISKTKYRKLLWKEKDIPSDFIERDLRNTQYIAKKSLQLLKQISKDIVSTNGKITDKLRQEWGLTDVLKELSFNTYMALGMVKTETTKDGKNVKIIENWTKRSDQRHHVIDAITIAFTTAGHVQYLNQLNTIAKLKDFDQIPHEYSNLYGLKNNLTEIVKYKNGKKKLRFKKPMDNLREVVKNKLQEILVSYKVKNKTVTKNTNFIKVKKSTKNPNKIKRKNGYYVVQNCLTPRGQLHNETIYSKYIKKEIKIEKINAYFDKEKINMVTKPSYRKALLKRLENYDFDPKKAFTGKNSLKNSPIYTSDGKVVPENVKVIYEVEKFSKREPINEKIKIEKVIDKKIRDILNLRLKEYGNDPKKAFSNLDKNPIWFNKKEGIQIKKVRYKAISNAQSLHEKHNHFGKLIKLGNKTIPNDWVSTSNNHHIAIYQDKDGNLHEKPVAFFEAVERKMQGLDVIDKNYNNDEWHFLFSLKQNEMFVFPNPKNGFYPNQIDLKDKKNYKKISKNLYRVQKISSKDYTFRHHLESSVNRNIKDLTFKRISSVNNLKGVVKVRINHIGEIVQIGEY